MATETAGARVPATDFRWFVPKAGYSWSREYEVTPLRVAGESRQARDEPRGPWLVEPTPIGTSPAGVWYEPLVRRRDLHVKFANLSIGEDEAALRGMARFANEYGWLGAQTSWVASADAQAAGRPAPVHLAEHAGTWLEAISTVKGLLQVAAAYRAENLEELKRWVHWKHNPLAVQMSFLWPGTTSPRGTPSLAKVPAGPPRRRLRRGRLMAARRGATSSRPGASSSSKSARICAYTSLRRSLQPANGAPDPQV